MCPEPRPLLPYNDCGAALRPSTAFLMLRLANVKEGDVVIDPMCGIGTVPLVAAAHTRCAYAFAGDVDPHVLNQVRSFSCMQANSLEHSVITATNTFPAPLRTQPGGTQRKRTEGRERGGMAA